MMGYKSALLWWQTREWCRSNPGKKAIIYTPEGVFSVQFDGHKEIEKSQYKSSEFVGPPTVIDYTVE